MRTCLQTELSECGLACLVTISHLHGRPCDLSVLRQRFPTGLRGLTLPDLARIADALGFHPRPVRAELEDLASLQLPCILHWNHDHFVVLRKVRRGRLHLCDPAMGDRVLALSEASPHFTGVALELTPAARFDAPTSSTRFDAWEALRHVHGLRAALGRILLVTFVLEMFAIAAPLLQQWVIDGVLVSGDLPLLTVLVLGFALMLMIQTLLGAARGWMSLALSQSLALQWSTNVFARLFRLPVAYFEQRQLGDIASRFESTAAIQRTLTQGAMDAVMNSIMALSALVMMLIYSPMLTGVVAGAVGVYVLLRTATYGTYRNAAAERVVMAAAQASHFLETLRAIGPLKLFGGQLRRQTRWQSLMIQVQNRDLRTASLTLTLSAAESLLFGLEQLVILWLGARLILAQGSPGADAFSIGMLFAFIAFRSQFISRATALVDFAVDLKALSIHSDRLADIVMTPPEEQAAPDVDLSHLPATLEFRNVGFRFSETSPWLFRGLHLVVRPGEHLAITGMSGSGKSTLLKIALGLLRPSEGEVCYGGVPFHRLGLNNLRRQIGTVLQQDVLLTGSIAQNIAFFDDTPSMDRIEDAARLASIDADIHAMPMGYHTVIGDLGAGLSGGQRQRVLLARCIYKQARLIALDEATSELDPSNERAIAAALRQLAVTRITIAHRPETIADADLHARFVNGTIEIERSINRLDANTATQGPAVAA